MRSGWFVRGNPIIAGGTVIRKSPKRVTENKGKKTPGVDGELWGTPQDKTRAIALMTGAGYKPQPLRRVHIPKANGRKRPLGIPTMLDRAMQALYLMTLEPIVEVLSDPNSYGFRAGRSTADAAGQQYLNLAKKHSATWVVDADITGCFDNISHEWILENTPMNFRVLQKWLKAGYIEDRVDRLFPTEAGTPQGGIISPTLANHVLNGLESHVKDHFRNTRTTREYQRTKVNVVRYADDFVITAATKEIAEEAMEVARDFLKGRGLELSDEKTSIRHIEEGFDFLGWNFRKYNGKLLIKPSKKNVSNLLDKVRNLLKGKLRTAPQNQVVKELRLILIGWAEYHKGQVAKETYSRVDMEVWKALWSWAKRRHPNKGKRWIKERYFHTVGNRHWMFGTWHSDEDGKEWFNGIPITVHTPIKRHVKVKSEATPFDPQWEEYFEQRRTDAMRGNKTGITKLDSVWRRQDGICPICRQPLNLSEENALHHRVPKSLGGSDRLDNLTLLHGNCHRQLHSQYALNELPAL
ncbi:MAG: group II intron reverse transcriptase/maturase [Lamprobacter sp.]|uniref:group II intron reverse transcriptase/maturase n=1 Tax=Lamprobacter sp. TaxID=3100796 RepID=UPI002B25DD5D|nr:group II intron reverse transcriptase/maturase [Lamprobacter sp.]MEA3642920.1 group II intron reverse transcriptase/maturase [Lamprobacter sp.]